MTTVTSEALIQYLQTHRFANIANTSSLIAVVFLIAVIAEREIVRMRSPEVAQRNVVAFGIVAVPMILMFGAVILLRFVKLS